MPASHRPAPRPPARSSCAGRAGSSVAPDVAELRLGVAVTRPTAAAARADAATMMAAILGAVEAAGVARARTCARRCSRSSRATTTATAAPPTLTGYELANVVEVTVRDLARLGDVVDGTLAAGATSMDGLSFRVDDPAPAERDARLAAMAAARARADVLAEAAGLTIRGVQAVVEGGAVPPPGPAVQGRAHGHGRRRHVDPGRGWVDGDRGHRDGHLRAPTDVAVIGRSVGDDDPQELAAAEVGHVAARRPGRARSR